MINKVCITLIGNIAYSDYSKKSDIHGTVLYPAVMVAPVQSEILKKLIDMDKKVSIFDPFHGSGTALYESGLISSQVQVCGCDINPLANLMTRTKLQGVTKKINKDIQSIKSFLIEIQEEKTIVFPNVDKWFRPDIQKDLGKIREAIIKIKSKRNRLFFWCMLCDVVRRYSNTRSSTYKLHTRPLEMITKIENKVISDFIISIEKNASKYDKKVKNFLLYKCDTMKKIKRFGTQQFDISITSPPYGDNATTVPYGQFSILALHWIDPKDLEMGGWELDNYSSIDQNSLGGKNSNKVLNEYNFRLLEPYLNEISSHKQTKVVKFFSDYFVFLDELSRVTKKHIVMTLGNRTVDGININLTDITVKYLEHLGFINVDILKRKIPNKRIPRKTSKVKNHSVESMNDEYVIIHRRLMT